MTEKLKTIYFLSLGCPKNRVDTEVMAGIADQQNLEIVADPGEADVIVVNTCAFIESAKQESIDALLTMGEFKKTGRLKKLVSAGCLSQRYSEAVGAGMEEVDYLLGTGEVNVIGDVLRGEASRLNVGPAAHFLRGNQTPRFVEPGAVSAYLKIGDGCNRKCAFCAIPAIRGEGKSVPLETLVDEARGLVESGIKELVLVAQDLMAYGRDLPGDSDLEKLLAGLNAVDGLAWIRLLYLYPDRKLPALLQTMGDLEKVVPYVDIPIQHISENMLDTMRRGHGKAFLARTIRSIRDIRPGIFMRTSVLVGHPGETKEDFKELLEFLEEVRFDRLGAFRYSNEEGTGAAAIPHRVKKRDSYNRWRKVMALGRRVSKAQNKALRGKTLPVLIEGPADDQGFVMVGRHIGQAPDIDGITYIVSTDAKPGDILQGKVVKTEEFDLVVEPI